MLDVIVQAGGLILCGVVWRGLRPLGLDAEEVRRNLTGVVYVLLLPALVLGVLWRAPLSLDAVRIALSAAAGVIFGLGASWLWYRWQRQTPAAAGALILAAAFPNATYLGLPVLEASLGEWSRMVAIQYDLFACTPLLLSVGVVVAAHFGEGRERSGFVVPLAKVPALWAALAGTAFNVAGLPLSPIVAGWLDLMGSAVVPLMLFSLGLGLMWRGDRRLGILVPVLVIQLLLTPLLIWPLAALLGLSGQLLTAVVLEAAMPSMVLGIVLCDRYRLDTGLYAMAVTLSTALSSVTLPLWFERLSSI